MKSHYGGFIPESRQSSPNTVVTSAFLKELKEGPTKTPEAEEPKRDTLTKSYQQEILIPYSDKKQRIDYLYALKDYLNSQLAIVESQLDAES